MRLSFGIPCLLVVLGALAGCSAGASTDDTGGTTSTTSGGGVTTGTTTTTGSSTSSSSSGGGTRAEVYPAPHPSEPVIPKGSGVVLKNPSIFTVTFPNDPEETQIEQFASDIVTTDWWTEVNGSYGVGAGTNAGHTIMPAQLPAALEDAQLQAWIQTEILAGSLPAPTDQTVYALYVPSSTVITLDDGGTSATSCRGFLGYHDTFNMTFNGSLVSIVYAVINECGAEPGQSVMDGITQTASHEFSEAATDPHPIPGQTAYVILDNNAWTQGGGEVADMCNDVGGTSEMGWSLVRIWNNDYAKTGDQPCIPFPANPENVPFFNAGIVDEALTAKAGTTVTTEVECYSFGPLPEPLTLLTQAYGGRTPVLTVTPSPTTCNNGDKVKLTIDVASNAVSGTVYYYSLTAQLDENTGHVWRGMVKAQ